CRASMTGLGFEGQLTTDGLREKMSQKRSESHSLPGRLRREERFGDTFHDFRAHSGSFIANHETDLVGTQTNGSNQNRFGVGTGIEGILYQRGQCFNCRTCRNDTSERVRRVDFQNDSSHMGRESVSNLSKQFVKIGCSWRLSEWICALRSHAFKNQAAAFNLRTDQPGIFRDSLVVKPDTGI